MIEMITEENLVCEIIDILVSGAETSGCCVATRRDDNWVFMDGEFDAEKAVRAMLQLIRERGYGR